MKIIKFQLIIALFLATSCDNILDVEPVSSITGSGYWNEPGDATGYLTGIYSRLRDGNGGGAGGVMNTTYWFEDRGDAFVVGVESGVSNAWQQNLVESNAPDWTNFYNVIHHCNLLLKNAPDIDFNVQSDLDRILAETYFIRAITYFSLLRTFGDVPLELEPTESDDKPMTGRSPAGEVMQLVLDDIERAIDLFPEQGIRNRSRASRRASYALRADALLWKTKVLEGNRQDLELAVESIDLATEGLTLLPDFGDVFSTANKRNGETLFVLHFERDEKSDHYGSRLKPRDIFVQDAVNVNNLPYARGGARSVYAPSPKLEQLFDENPNDVRIGHSIIKAIGPTGQTMGVFDNKFRGTAYPEDRFFENDIIVYRKGGLILLKAEALAALNRMSEAVSELNTIRHRAGIGDYEGPMDKETMEKEILNERFRELYFELKRWPDLVRFHSAGTINIYEEVPNLQGRNLPLFFPIPRTQIDLNPLLEQTDGY